MYKRQQEAIEQRNWDHALSVCGEILKLDTQNADAAALRARAIAGKRTKEQIQQLLRDADSARHSGNYDTAKQIAGRASELDPSDSRIQAICRSLEQEAEEARRKVQLRRLLQNAQDQIAAGHLTDASGVIAEAEKLSSSDADLLRLKDELADEIRKEERKRLVLALRDQAETALTLEQLHAAMREVTAGLEKYPSEPILLRLKLQMEPRLRDQVSRKLVAEVSNECSPLPPAEALARVRDALVHLPGNEDLLALESAISRRLTRQQREQMLADYLAKARALLEDHLYIETVKVLETCESKGFSSPEMSDLLDIARSAAAERVSQDMVERSFLEAKRLLEEQNYEAVLKLLPPVLRRVDEPALRRQLEDASIRQQALEQRVEQVIAAVQGYCDSELYDAAIGLIGAESAGVRQVERVRSALESSRKMLANEAARLEAMGGVYATLDEPGCTIAFECDSPNEFSTQAPAGVANVEQRLGARVRMIVDRQVTKCIEAAKQLSLIHILLRRPGYADALLSGSGAYR